LKLLVEGIYLEGSAPLSIGGAPGKAQWPSFCLTEDLDSFREFIYQAACQVEELFGHFLANNSIV
jgi:hypothetical protein